MNAVRTTLLHSHTLGLPLDDDSDDLIVKIVCRSYGKLNHLYGDVHALPNAGVGVHHLVLGQEQSLFVTPRQVS